VPTIHVFARLPSLKGRWDAQLATSKHRFQCEMPNFSDYAAEYGKIRSKAGFGLDCGQRRSDCVQRLVTRSEALAEACANRRTRKN
jgi:hypothetical protein